MTLILTVAEPRRERLCPRPQRSQIEPRFNRGRAATEPPGRSCTLPPALVTSPCLYDPAAISRPAGRESADNGASVESSSDHLAVIVVRSVGLCENSPVECRVGRTKRTVLDRWNCADNPGGRTRTAYRRFAASRHRPESVRPSVRGRERGPFGHGESAAACANRPTCTDPEYPAGQDSAREGAGNHPPDTFQ
jgi:hypothetical protein